MSQLEKNENELKMLQELSNGGMKFLIRLQISDCDKKTKFYKYKSIPRQKFGDMKSLLQFSINQLQKEIIDEIAKEVIINGN
jgi:hypothetical protein